jgi:hypothetical protein
MSDQTPQSAPQQSPPAPSHAQPTQPQAAPPPRKGVNPLVYVAIGCGGLIVLGVIGALVLGLMCRSAGKKIMESSGATLEKGPGGTMHMRVNKGGQQGEMTFEGTPGRGTVTIKGSKGGAAEETTVESSGDDGSGSIHIKGKDGESMVGTFGKGSIPTGFPKRCPIYPGTNVTQGTKMSMKDSTMFSLILTTKDASNKVADWYEAEIPKGGYEIKLASEQDGSKLFILGTGDDTVGSVNVAKDKALTTITISFTEKSKAAK